MGPHHLFARRGVAHCEFRVICQAEISGGDSAESAISSPDRQAATCVSRAKNSRYTALPFQITRISALELFDRY